MKDWIAAGIALAMLGIIAGPLLFARYYTVKRHKEQFKGTGAPEFALPSARSFEALDDVQPPQPEAPPAEPMTIVDTETGELVRVGVDGMPLTEADVSARTPSTSLTVDTERLAEILQLEKTGEYLMNAATWVECDAAEQWLKDPLGSPLLPPLPLVEAAGNPALADTFYALYHKGALTTDWSDPDSEFKFWDSDIPLVDAETAELEALIEQEKAAVR